jgi:hypothetical protein
VPDSEQPAAGKQLRLKLEQTPPPAKTTATVITLIDAETRAVRKDAIERVKSRGIFSLPDKGPAR